MIRVRVAVERVVAAVERHAQGGATATTVLTRPDGTMTVMTADAVVRVDTPEWRIGETIRMHRDRFVYNANPVYGVLFDETHSEPRLLNERATMNDIGRRLGQGLDPLAYAEVVAELFSGDDLNRPVAFAADFGRAAGELFTGSKVYPDPVVHRRDDRIDIRFFSGRGVIVHGAGSGNHIYRWHITGGPGRIPQWERDYVGYDGPDH